MKTRWKGPALLLITTAVCGVAAETAYRFHLRSSYASASSVPPPAGAFWVIRPDRNACVYSMRKNFTHASAGWSFKTNGQGFRGRELAKTGPGIRRILALGDSFTFGWGVSRGKAYPHQLEGRLKAAGQKAAVFNAGVPGYNTAQEACLLEDILGAAAPHVVLLGYVVNDAEPQHTVGASPDAEHRYVKLWLLERAKELVNRLGSDRDPIFELGYRRHSLNYLEGFEARSPKWRESRAALARMARLCQDRKVPLLVFLLPDFDEHFDESYGPAPIHAKVKQWGKELGLPVYDLLDRLRGKGHKQYRLEEGHPNEKGHAAIAAFVAEVLNREQGTGNRE